MRSGPAVLQVITLAIFFMLLLSACQAVLGGSNKTGTISGVVTDSATGKPVKGTSVLLKGTKIGLMTDEKGQFVIGRLDCGRYTVVANSIGYRADEINGVEVGPDSTSRLTFLLAESHSHFDSVWITEPKVAEPSIAGGIEGKVEDSLTGKPLYGASVLVLDHMIFTFTDSTGKFAIGPIRVGVYRLKVTMDGYEQVGLTDSIVVKYHKTSRIRVKMGKKKQAGTIHLNGGESQ